MFIKKVRCSCVSLCVCACAFWDWRKKKKEEAKLPGESLEPNGPPPRCISCPAGCACSADNPSCSCKRLAKWGGQLPWVCLFLSCPTSILPRQAAHIVQPLFSCQTETFTCTHTHTVTPKRTQPFVFTALVSPCRAISVRLKKTSQKKTISTQATSCRQMYCGLIPRLNWVIVFSVAHL